MNLNQFGESNSQWKGGISVASNGYILIRVGKDHHLADVRGYAYEHRLVAEQKLGRKLKRDEIVHHVDGTKQNNAPSNIEVIASIAHHRYHHRKAGSARRRPEDLNCKILCACGCLGELDKFDKWGRPRTFITGHNAKDRHVITD